MAQRPGSAGEFAETRADSGTDPVPSLWLTVPARPGQLPGLRRALREWLTQAGVDEADATAVLVAVGEATSNAVEHAYRDLEPGLVRLTARLDQKRALVVEVIDNGRWRPAPAITEPTANVRRGRGMAMMQATMDEVVVSPQDDGTTVRMRLNRGVNN